jgi:AcrR family transcriptional regulator
MKRTLNRAEQKERTRRRLIEEALRLSAQQGFSSLSLREVATAAGITPAAFYRHFRDMEDLGLALLDEVGLSLRRLLRDARHRVEGSGRGVEVSIETFLDYLNRNANHFQLLLGERQGGSLAFRKAIHAEIDRFVGELTEDLERTYREAGDPLRNPGYCAEAMVAIVFTVGGEALSLPRHRQEQLGERLVEEVKMVLRGAKASAWGAGPSTGRAGEGPAGNQGK